MIAHLLKDSLGLIGYIVFSFSLMITRIYMLANGENMGY